MMDGAGFHEQQLVDLEARTEEAAGTSEIEGEPVSKVAVRSSIARRLHIETATVDVHDARAQGLVDMTLDATLQWNEPLTVERLHRWHRWLALVGAFRNDRDGPMQVVSGRDNAPIVHFEAPPASRIPAEVNAFLEWFNAPPKQDGILMSGVAHLWFVTIHPYEDGNGRIARAVADLALARDERSDRRFFSMSREINQGKGKYYDALENAQRGTLDITAWLSWFLGSYMGAIARARGVAHDVLRSDAFWRRHSNVAFSERQRRVLDRYMHQFEGKLTTKKWAALTKSSPATAARDIADLLEKGVLVQNPGGSKNTSFSLIGFPARGMTTPET